MRSYSCIPQATRNRSRSEYGSISTTILLTATLGAFRRPTVFILMKPAASSFASVRVRLGCALPGVSVLNDRAQILLVVKDHEKSTRPSKRDIEGNSINGANHTAKNCLRNALGACAVTQKLD